MEVSLLLGNLPILVQILLGIVIVLVIVLLLLLVDPGVVVLDTLGEVLECPIVDVGAIL